MKRKKKKSEHSFFKGEKFGAITAIVAAIIGIFQFNITGCHEKEEPQIFCAFSVLEEKINSSPIPFNGTYYNIDSAQIIFPVELTIKDIETHFDSLRVSNFKQVLNETRKKFPISINEALFEKYQEEAYKKEELVNEEKGLHHLLKYREKIYFSEDAQACVYMLKLFSPKMRRDILPLGETISFYIEQTNSFQRFYAHLDQPIDIGRIAEELLADRNFIQRLNNELKVHEGLLKVLNLYAPTDKALEQLLTFGSSKYKLEYLHQSIIDQIVHHYQKQIRKNPEKKYRIQCMGYTDSVTINGYIPYWGKGTFDSGYQKGSNKKRMPQAIDFNNPQSTPIGTDIRNNLQLSYARAYEGIRYLHQQIESTNIIRGHIEYRYQGLGIDRLKGANKRSKRRIEFQLIKL